MTSARYQLLLLAAALMVAVALRFTFAMPGCWSRPWTPHHFDEHILPYEALALWEGITPREVGWPASPLRLTLSAAYTIPLLAEERSHLIAAKDSAAAMALVAGWSGRRVADGAPLYVFGRSVSALFGVLQVLLMILAARAWLGREVMPIAAILAATTPLAVTHSQLILADVSGACFATLVLALAPAIVTHVWLAPVAGVVAACAAASKFHFVVWLALPLASIWCARAGAWPRRTQLAATAACLAAFLITFMAFVPWTWTNAALAMKEFAGVVLAKTSSVNDIGVFFKQAGTLLSGLGALTLLGAAAGVTTFLRQPTRMGVWLLIVTAGTAVFLSRSAVVFDRYGLVMLPALTLVATVGWHRIGGRWAQIAGLVPIGLLAFGLSQAWSAIGQFRHLNSYHLAHEWLIEHLPDGASLVLFSEDNQYIPRTAAQLSACAAYAQTDSAYQEKWRTNGVAVAPGSGMPMRGAVINDELFHAFWCSRELLASPSPAFAVYRFHSDPRFQTLDQPTLQREFMEGLGDPTRGFDAVLVHWPMFRDLAPATTFKGRIGPTLYVYLRPGVTRHNRRQ